ncbi:NrfD/PsrC family molybdoenzyme membrane anchor subunit [Turicimonas muris]|uniref:NrfD/PsrC family molybdoenzyme membrane anchor subunit n=1 Tax=Turicimonas muris TaxID=1796652 RepID=UPI0030C6604B
MHQLHLAECPIVLVEAMCIFMIAVSLITGTEATQIAFTAFTSGTWAVVFRVGAILISMVIPLACSLSHSAACFYFGCSAAIVGMMCLRLFILYAGQLNGLN